MSSSDIDEVVSIYQSSISLESDPKKGEHRIADPIIMILSRFLSVYLAISLLEYGLSKSPFNYFFKVELVSLYKKAGCFRSIIEIYSNMDIKSIQHESLGYLVFDVFND